MGHPETVLGQRTDGHSSDWIYPCRQKMVREAGFAQVVIPYHREPDYPQLVCSERRKQTRTIQTVSLDAEIPGTDGLTYGDIITTDNIRYQHREEKQVEIKFDERIPEAAKQRISSVAVEVLLEFLSSDHKTMDMTFIDKKEAASKAGTMRSWKKKNEGTNFEVYRLDNTVYVEKIQKGKGKIRCQ